MENIGDQGFEKPVFEDTQNVEPEIEAPLATPDPGESQEAFRLAAEALPYVGEMTNSEEALPAPPDQLSELTLISSDDEPGAAVEAEAVAVVIEAAAAGDAEDQAAGYDARTDANVACQSEDELMTGLPDEAAAEVRILKLVVSEANEEPASESAAGRGASAPSLDVSFAKVSGDNYSSPPRSQTTESGPSGSVEKGGGEPAAGSEVSQTDSLPMEVADSLGSKGSEPPAEKPASTAGVSETEPLELQKEEAPHDRPPRLGQDIEQMFIDDFDTFINELDIRDVAVPYRPSSSNPESEAEVDAAPMAEMCEGFRLVPIGNRPQGINTLQRVGSTYPGDGIISNYHGTDEGWPSLDAPRAIGLVHEDRLLAVAAAGMQGNDIKIVQIQDVSGDKRPTRPRAKEIRAEMAGTDEAAIQAEIRRARAQYSERMQKYMANPLHSKGLDWRATLVHAFERMGVEIGAEEAIIQSNRNSLWPNVWNAGGRGYDDVAQRQHYTMDYFSNNWIKRL